MTRIECKDCGCKSFRYSRKKDESYCISCGAVLTREEFRNYIQEAKKREARGPDKR